MAAIRTILVFCFIVFIYGCSEHKISLEKSPDLFFMELKDFFDKKYTIYADIHRLEMLKEKPGLLSDKDRLYLDGLLKRAPVKYESSSSPGRPKYTVTEKTKSADGAIILVKILIYTHSSGGQRVVYAKSKDLNSSPEDCAIGSPISEEELILLTK